MADLLRGFKCQTKLPQSLIDEYEYEARLRGDALIKNEAATAKRTATTLSKAAGEVRGMDTQDCMTLRAAAELMRRRASELGDLCKWAKAYHSYAVQHRRAEDLAQLNAFADARWGDDQRAFVLEAELLQTLKKTQDSGSGLGHFLHSRGLYTHVPPENFSLADSGPCAEQLDLNERQRTADILRRLGERDDVFKLYRGWVCLVGKRSYELYREFVSAAATKAFEQGRGAGHWEQ